MTFTTARVFTAALFSAASLASAQYTVTQSNTTTYTYPAQPAYPYPAPPVAVPAAVPVVLLAPQQLDQLTAPVALYPDPLLAQVLTASTYSFDLVTAAQWARNNPNAPQQYIDAQPWPAPVKALVHYPTVLDQLANNLSWTQQLGSAYLNQPADVMSSVQRLRAQAQTAGSLVSTPQQEVIVQQNTIYVIPAQPETIYVPVYDPGIVYTRPAPIRFSVGFHAGVWLDLSLDWHDRFVAAGVPWSRDRWERFHHPEERRVEVISRPERHPWTRDPGRPLVVVPARPEPDHRFYPAPAPHHDDPPRAFDYRPRPEVEHAESRGRESLHDNRNDHNDHDDRDDRNDHNERDGRRR